MRKILLALVSILGISVFAQAQTSRTVSLTTGAKIGPSAAPWIQEIGSGITNHTIIWNATGTISACSVKLEKSADGITWSDLIAGATCTSNGSSSLTAGTANYVRVNATTLTGTGTLSVRYLGFPPGTPVNATFSGSTIGIDQTTPGTTNGVVCNSGCSGGSLSNNNAAPSNNNGGVLPAVANAAAPSYAEGKQVLTSTDLSGNTRTIVTNTPTVNVTQVGTSSVPSCNTTVPCLPVQIYDSTGHVVNYNDTVTTNPASATAPIMSMNSASANSGLNAAMAATFDDTSPTSITENSFGFVRMSANRNQYMTIRDAAGNERGVNVNSSNQMSVSVDNTVTVASHAVTNAGTFAVQASQNAPAIGAGALKSGAVTSAMTGTTSTQVIAAVGSNYIYVTSCSFSNTHASVTTLMSLQDGSGGTVLWQGIVPFGGGSNITFPVPLKVPTIGNGLYVANVTTGSNTFVSCSGFNSTTSY